MAQMIPESPQCTKSERRIFDLLKVKLPDDFWVWHEPYKLSRGGGGPDLVIVGRDFGLLILEVKGYWEQGNVEPVKTQEGLRYRVKTLQDVLPSEESPLVQARNYLMKSGALRDSLKRQSILAYPNGHKHAGKPMFPMWWGAVFPNLTTRHAQELGITEYLSHPYVMYQDELSHWNQASGDALVRRLKQMKQNSFLSFDRPDRPLTDSQISSISSVVTLTSNPNAKAEESIQESASSSQDDRELIESSPTLTADQFSTIRAVITPESAIKTVAATPNSVPNGINLAEGSTAIACLDLDQERIARTLKDGHRLLSGVAGSGKTLILLARAKVLVNRHPDYRILILCHSIVLASHLRSLLHHDEQNPQYRRIEVLHFHDWAKDILGRLPRKLEQQSDECYDQEVSERTLQRLSQYTIDAKWDAVLIDEGHSFYPAWFECVVCGLKDPVNSNLLIVSDANQSLYPRPRFSWKSVGVRAQGRSQKLLVNYRNTKEILDAAWTVIEPLLDQPNLFDDTFPLIKPEQILRRGASPVLHLFTAKTDVVEAAITQIQTLLESGYAPSDIALLSRIGKASTTPSQSDKLLQTLLKRLQDDNIQTCWITQSQASKRSYRAQNPGIRVITTKSSLGLEFKVVLLLWVEQFADCCYSDLVRAVRSRRELYVGMTRAQEELHVFGAGRALLLQELQQTQRFQIAEKLHSYDLQLRQVKKLVAEVNQARA